ncbi:DUF1080 domain-containing protein [Parabacteroides sp. Marseille-P3160]|uniref:3-keto-disaccharide hydrolase n=1 Tax=Parabacteroides sp. Marseille-P3160 TaxID=1917887 RepID=UPI0009BA77A5|nr:DUF1080 domain-containing protein [Parabacteroides sp. Marseille-P3160]
MKNSLCFLLLLIGISACQTSQKDKNASLSSDVKQEEWIQLFNGKDLTGWTPKITGYPVGENYANTFRVEDGLLKVSYDGYDKPFRNRFGHLFTDKKYSYYKLRVEYRFTGDQIEGGEGWAFRNSGAMLHCQSPASMHLDQDFPVSIEAQILGGEVGEERTTGNVCTPGTEIDINGEHYTAHCYSSHSKTYPWNEWATLEVEVRGDSIIHHIMDGDTILTYTKPIVAGGNVSPTPNVTPGPLKEGYIALQSESHPIEFRKVELLDLSEKTK